MQEFCETELIEGFFREQYGKTVTVLAPKQGVRRQLLEMAEKNAAEYLDKVIDKIRHREDMTVNACKSCRDVLGRAR